MSDYIKREIALDMFDIASCEDELLSLIKKLPAADVVEVVRCKGCKHCLEQDEYELWCYGRGFPASLTRANDYCSCGTDMRGENNEI